MPVVRLAIPASTHPLTDKRRPIFQAGCEAERNEAGSRIDQPLPQHLQVGIAAEKDRQRQRQRDVTQLVDGGRGLSGNPRARKEGVAGRAAQIERRGQRANCFDMRTASFPALERAHGMDRQARNGREFFLSEASRFPERPQSRAE